MPADHYGGFTVGLFVIYTGLRVLSETSLDLIDTIPPAELIERIKTAALQAAGVRSIEKCYARRTGLQYHVDLHVEVDPQITVAEAHDIATNVRHGAGAWLNQKPAAKSLSQYRKLLPVTDEQRVELVKWAQSRTLPAGDVFRARLILSLADG